MTITKAYKVRLYPTKTQQELMIKTFGCTRFVYNKALHICQETYRTSKRPVFYDELSKMLTFWKTTTELSFLKAVDKFALQNSLRNLCQGFTNMKHGAGHPKYKSKHDHHDSYKTQFTNNNIAVDNTYIKLPKLGHIRYRDKKTPQGKIRNVTISRTPSGRFYASVCVETEDVRELPMTGNQIGIDLGIKDFCAMSNHEKVENPHFQENTLQKIKKTQRELSRKTKGSSNWEKNRIRLARLYEKAANQKRDFLEKLSTMIVSENDFICIEDLNVSGMVKNHNFAQSILSTSWSEFTAMLTYKARWYGKTVTRIDRFYPSSQVCSVCGHKNPLVKDLSIREWICPVCGISHDRDINASTNILNEGLRQLEVV